jgi:hypothetical protein
MLDGTATRRFLFNLAGILQYGAESADGREVVAALDYIRKAPSMLGNLEVQR